MKKITLVCFTFILVMMSALAFAVPCLDDVGYYNNHGTLIDEDRLPRVTLHTKGMATREGPATEYVDRGRYVPPAKKVEAISYATDSNGFIWVQVEFITSLGAPRRLYAGHNAFEKFALSKIPMERYMGVCFTASKDIESYTGPGYHYVPHDMPISSGKELNCITQENNFYMVEYWVKGQIYRAWIPTSEIQ